MPCKTLSQNDVHIQVEALPECIPVRRNACCSGDDEFDRQVENAILKRLYQDDVWAWATMCVTAEWESLKETEYLGCCCYDGEEDFRNNSGYFEEMVDQAVANLNTRLQKLYEKMSV